MSNHVENTDKYIRLDIFDQNVATINGIRRTMLNNVPCYAFGDYLDPSDHAMIFSGPEKKRHSVLVDTLKTQAIPILSHRCTRVPIHTDDVTEPLLATTDKRKVFFVISKDDDITAPRVNTGLMQRIYSRDLVPFVYTKTDTKEAEAETETETETETEGGFVYNAVASGKVKDKMDQIFPFNVLIAQMNYMDRLHVILTPVRGIGADNCIYSPCTYTFSWRMDPKWLEKGEYVVSDAGTIRRKIEGVPTSSVKYLFTHDPKTGAPYGAIGEEGLGKPYGITLSFRYNGKMTPEMAMKRSIKKLQYGVDEYLRHYISAEDTVQVEEMIQESETGETEVTQIINIPGNSDLLDRIDPILVDSTIGKIICAKLLEIISRRIHEQGLDRSIWSYIMVAPQTPHRLIKHQKITVKLPSKLGYTHTELMKLAVEEIKADLDRLRAEF